MAEFLPPPASGRRFVATRSVRLADASSAGRLRLDAIARYLQDVANDDGVDSGIEGALYWVVRGVAIRLVDVPRFRDDVELTTWCSGYGSRFAERRTSITVAGRPAVEAAALWVSVDPKSGRPAVLGEQFHSIYGEAAGGRSVGSRLHHSRPPEGARRQQWHQRQTDYDLLGHANNSIALAAVEEVLTERIPTLVDVEYRAAVEPGDAVELVTADDMVWLTVEGSVRASARIEADA